MTTIQDGGPEIGRETLAGSFGAPPLLSYMIDCPRLKTAAAAGQRIDGFFRQRAAALERFCCTSALAEARRQRAALGERFVPLEIGASFQVLRCGGGLLSGFADGYRQMGARGSFLTRLSRTFALGGGQELPLQALFRRNAPWQRGLCAELEVQVRQRAAEEPGSYYKNAAALMWLRLSPHGYYLADDGLALWFPQGLIAPANTGVPTFLVLYDRLRPWLRREL